MITVSRLVLDHFRSWTHCMFDFTPGVNILQGANGLGKTNIVEALEVLSTGSSHRASSSLPLVQRGFQTATIRANIEEQKSNNEDSTTTFELTIRARGSNRARINGGASIYMRDIIGKIPFIAFTPDDQRLVWGDPAVRRHFIDQTAAVLVRGYAQRLQQFTHIAKQRAALLKQLGSRDGDVQRDAALSGLEIWTGQFIDIGSQITRDRNHMIELLNTFFGSIVRELSDDAEEARLVYEPSFDELLTMASNDEAYAAISAHFQRIYPGEVARGVNLIGPQRDDVSIELNGMPAREYSSNGESWTLALAMKMAVYRLLEQEHGERPIVVLDDVFAQLDPTRRAKIMEFAAKQDQVLITAAAQSDVPQFADANVIDVAHVAAQSDDDPLLKQAAQAAKRGSAA